MNLNLDKLQNAAKVALLDCLKAQPEDKVLIVIDEPMIQLGEVFFQEGQRLGLDVVIAKMTPRDNHGCEPPAAIAQAMAASDVVFCITSKSLSHTQARHNANAQGARVASMPGVTPEMMERALVADYNWIAAISEKIAQILTKGKKVQISSHHGTDLEFQIETRVGKPDTGLLHQPGCFGNLPAGETYIAPVEGTAQGILVIDGAMSGIGKLEEPLVMKVEKGLVVDVQGKDKDKLEQIFHKYGEKSRNIAELGVGTNPAAQLTGIILEDEKVLGTIHIALGDNSTFGGKVQVASHLDGIITKPTVKVDGELLMEQGELKI